MPRLLVRHQCARLPSVETRTYDDPVSCRERPRLHYLRETLLVFAAPALVVTP
jgi:hypothetical protein